MKKIKILLVEDVPEDIRFTEIQLQEIFGEGHTLEIAEYISNALAFLKEKAFDIVLLDLSLPDSRGLTGLGKLRKATSAPLIVYSGLSDNAIKESALKMGAMDYLIKGKTNNKSLEQSIINALNNL